MIRPARIFVVWIVIVVVMLLVLSPSSPVIASSTLENASDTINNTQVSATAEHIIIFTLPADSQLIASSDYIILEFPNFTNLTNATQVSGNYFGTPSFSLGATKVTINNIAVLPGRSIQILGITATNPASESLNTVTITIAEDAAGTIIRNFDSIQAGSSGNEVSVSANVITPISSITFSGNTAPGTIVSITENGSVIGTDTAGGTFGGFTKYVTGIEPDTHTFSLYGVDQQFRTTSPITVTRYTPVFQNTVVANLLLSPTIEISDTSIIQGDDLVASGSAIPGGAISLFTESPLRTYTASAGALGLWDYTVTDTNDYIPGDYRIYSLVQNSIGNQSLFSPGLQFTVAATSSGSTSSCDITQGDLTCDGNVNLNDFSVLMYYWGSSNAAADINSDAIVNLVDFSVMMYYWGT